MPHVQEILAWVQNLPEPQAACEIIPSPAPSPSKKRKAHQLASPPVSINKMLTPRKRRIEATEALFDPDTTPRPKTRSVPSLTSISQSAASDTDSVRSGASSPKKQMMSLRLSETGVEYQSLNIYTVPDVARTMFKAIRRISRGRRLLPDAMRPVILPKLQDRDEDHEDWEDAFKSADEDEDALPGRIPSFEEVEKVLIEATECEDYKHDEASWNKEVHLRLLEGIYRHPLGKPCDSFNSIGCTSARAHREFTPVSSTSTMIDMCIYASLNHDEKLKAAAVEFSKRSPAISVNHTDFPVIQERPLLISIETKKPAVQGDKAQLQIGVWHAAQWSFLRWAVGQKLLRQRQAQGIDAPTTEEGQREHKAMKLAALAKLGFIPGIIVQGHRWHLVLSTYEGSKTTLWAEWEFGSTKGLLDIYGVVAGVRELTAWGRDVYLPWFKENVLDLAIG